jgi:peptidyl-prolyl cis-trans isomerase A (cyclophilin A)
MTKARSSILLALLILVPVLAFAEDAAETAYTAPDDWPPGWYARIETSMGRIVIRLLPEQSPESVAHFVAFARGTLEWTDPVLGGKHKEPYYDGAEVYRARGGALFMVGNRSGSGVFAPFVYVPPKGAQPVNFNAAWRVGNVQVGPRVSASRFLITAGAMPNLNQNSPCFGVVMYGKETVFQITAVKTYRNETPIDPVVVKSVDIFSIGEVEPLPEAVPYYPEAQPTEIKRIERVDD